MFSKSFMKECTSGCRIPVVLAGSCLSTSDSGFKRVTGGDGTIGGLTAYDFSPYLNNMHIQGPDCRKKTKPHLQLQLRATALTEL